MLYKSGHVLDVVRYQGQPSIQDLLDKTLRVHCRYRDIPDRNTRALPNAGQFGTKISFVFHVSACSHPGRFRDIEAPNFTPIPYTIDAPP